MLPTPSTEAAPALDAGVLAELGRIATRSILDGLAARTAPAGRASRRRPVLNDDGASFVTLKQGDVLRGCMGSLEARRALAADVAANAYAAAFRDPRFAPLSHGELAATSVEVSVLTTPRPLEFRDEADLLARLRPAHDGVVLDHEGRRATYLPAVWRLLPEPCEFIRELRKKAGISTEIPLTSVNVLVYTTIHSIPSRLAAAT